MRKMRELFDDARKLKSIHFLLLSCAKNLGMLSGFNVHPILPKILAQFFTGTNPGKSDLDIPLRLESGKLDQVFGEIENANLLPHVKHEDLAALTHRCRL